MDDLKKYALDDEYDNMIENAANSIDDNTCIISGDDFPEEIYSDTNTDNNCENQYTFSDNGYTSSYDSNETTYKTFDNTFGGQTTYGSDGTVYKTQNNILFGGKTTYGSDGSTYRTNDDILFDGKTTYGSNGITYKTEKSFLAALLRMAVMAVSMNHQRIFSATTLLIKNTRTLMRIRSVKSLLFLSLIRAKNDHISDHRQTRSTRKQRIQDCQIAFSRS